MAVIVVGSANVDLVWRGDHLPRAGETVTDGEHHRVFGGKGANQASAAARLGTPTVFVGCVGDDALGAGVRDDLVGRGVDCAWLATAPAPTGVALIMVGARGENAIAVAPGANRALTAHHTRAALLETAGDGDSVLVSLEIALDAAHTALETARERGARAILNPAPWRDDARALLDAADIVVPNDIELAAIAAAGALPSDATTLVVTRGEDGLDVIAGGRTTQLPAYRVDAVDTTGAGDAFCGALAAELAAGATVVDAARFGAAVAALACAAIGARGALPTREAAIDLVNATS